jgi:predicted phage terminase large subunit-like protein
MALSKATLGDYIALRKEIERRKATFDVWLPTASPDLTWELRHLKYMRRDFDVIANREESKKIMEFSPPQHGKSTQNTIHFAAYYLYKQPSSNIVVAANTQDLANKFSRRIRDLASRFVDISKDRKAVSEWETTVGGSVTCGGIGIGTSLPIDLLIVDDPIKTAEQARSKTYREWLWEWWQFSIAPRIREVSSVVFTMTSWHQDDLAARILESEKDEWEVRKLPALCESKEQDPLGREEGEALWPEQFSVAKLNKLREQTPQAFQALFQLRPSAKEGDIFERSTFKFFTTLPKFKYIIQSWDTAFKKNESNDYSVCTTWGVTDTGYYLLHVWRKRCLYHVMKRAMIALYDKFRPQWVLIEDKASGQSVIQELLYATDLPVKPIKPVGSKEDRAATTTGLFDAGRILFPERASWLVDLMEELTIFPNGRHDDQIDSMTQFLNFIRQHRRSTPKFTIL